LEEALRRQRLHPERVGEGEACLDAVRRLQPDAVVLSDGLPDASSSELLASIRKVSTVPVLVLLRSGGVVTELLHFGLGADDVVWLPASPRVIAARVTRLARPASEDRERLTWKVGALLVDRYQHSIRFGGTPVDVTPMEYRLLAAMAGAPGRAFSRSELIGEAMPDSDALERAIDVHIWSLRRKLERAGAPEVVETVRGVGYRLAEPGSPTA
jgi:two-component system response regulator AdeR